MKSFHADVDGEQLYCNLHLPAGRLVQGEGIVLCPPLGHEYYRAYRALARLADHLASRGHVVARFDYRGQGESSGNAGGYALQDHVRDAATIAAEVRRAGSLERIAWLGMRYGAVVAARAAREDADSRVIFWEPLASGADWLRSLDALNRRVLGDLDRFADERSIADCAHTELVGYIYGSALLDDVRGFDAAAVDDASLLETRRDYGWEDERRIGEIIVDPAVNRAAEALFREAA